MTTRIFLDEAHWAWLLKSVFEEMQNHPHTYDTPLGQLWRLMVQANKHKRFTFEVENADLLAIMGEKNDGANLESYMRSRWSRPMAGHRDDGPS